MFTRFRRNWRDYGAGQDRIKEIAKIALAGNSTLVGRLSKVHAPLEKHFDAIFRLAFVFFFDFYVANVVRKGQDGAGGATCSRDVEMFLAGAREAIRRNQLLGEQAIRMEALYFERCRECRETVPLEALTTESFSRLIGRWASDALGFPALADEIRDEIGRTLLLRARELFPSRGEQ